MELTVLDMNDLPSRPDSNMYLQSELIPIVDFPEMTNTSLISAARGEETERIPVWVMRQAGRYLEEFRKMRENHNFFEMCTTPSLACEVTLMPIRRFDLDAAIIFSDILVLPQAMGMEVVMEPGVGPVFPSPLQSPDDLDNLKIPLITDYDKYFDAIYLTRHSLKGKVPLIGFTGGPFTLLTYMIEGKGSTAFTKARKWIYKWPEASHRLLTLLSQACAEFLVGQARSGAQVLQVFESHAGLLGMHEFDEFLLNYIKQICSVLKEKIPEVPLIIFCKDAGWAVESLCKTQFDVIGLDWTVNPQWARTIADSYGKCLQGNLDPASLYGSPELIEKKTSEMKAAFGKTRHIANLGHGIYPDVEPSHLEVFINSVHS